MSLPDLCIRRPVFTTMLGLVPVVFGLIALARMGVGLYPNVDLPIIVVTTSRPGASVDEVESGVTKPIEEVINTLSDIDELRSDTTEGLSRVIITFALRKRADVAFQEVQAKLNQLLARLPEGTQTPIVDKLDIGAAPVMTIAVSGRDDLRELTDLAEDQVAEALGGLPGVGAVDVVGGRRRAILVTLDAARLEAHGLSVEQVRRALRAENVELPGGRVEAGRRERVLRTLGRYADARGLADLIVAERGGRPVRLRDLGGPDVVADDAEPARALARLDGRPAVTVVVQKQSGANTVAVADVVQARLRDIRAALARAGDVDVRLEVIRDQTVFIRASLHEVQVHLVLGAALVVITIIAFLRDWRATLVAAVAIPTSLLAAFPVMGALGLTLDNITLIGLVLVIGIVIDDAVIVVENIVRWMDERGLSAREAAAAATRELTLAVVATTLSLAVIFVPIAFMSGTVGMFLRSFGITCAVCILASLAVSLTVTPMLASRLLRRGGGAHGGHGPAGGLYGRLLERPYLAALRFSLRRRWVVVLATALTVGSTFPVRALGWPGLVGLVGFDFVPKDDQGELILSVTTPEGWSLEQTSAVLRGLERRVAAWPEVTTVLTQVGEAGGRRARGEGSVTRGTVFVRLVPLGRRDPPFTQFQVMARARALLREYPDLRASVQAPRPVEAPGNATDIEFLLVGPDLARLREYAAAMIERLRGLPGLADVDTTLADRLPELRVALDRERLADLGLTVEVVAGTLRTLVGGEVVSDWKDEVRGEQYDVWLRAAGVDRGDPAAIGALTVPSASGRLVPLHAVATLEPGLGPAQVDRAMRQRKVSIVANLAGMPTGTAAREFAAAFAALGAPPGYALLTTGQAKNSAESNQAFLFAFSLSLVLMYMILAAQFESFVHPVTILLAVPLTIPFAFVSQLLLGGAMTLFSFLGLFLLFGIVKKNGILQVDATNQLRAQAAADPAVVPFPYAGEGTPRPGWEAWVASRPAAERVRLWALVEANRIRLRPILMTTVMLVAAMIPIALGEGPGAANRADLAEVVVGGQSLSLLLSLLVTPVAYALFDDLGALAARLGRRGAPAAAPGA